MLAKDNGRIVEKREEQKRSTLQIHQNFTDSYTNVLERGTCNLKRRSLLIVRKISSFSQ